MHNNNSLIVRACLIGLCVFASWQSSDAKDAPDLTQIAAAGRQTLSRFERDPVAWTTVFELPDGAEAYVEIKHAPTMRHVSISLQNKTQRDELVRFIDRDGFWYVTHRNGHFKYRPYEAPLVLPALYVFLARSDLRVIIDEMEQPGRFDAMQDSVAVYRTVVPEPLKQLLKTSLEAIVEFEERNPDRINEEFRRNKEMIEHVLQRGAELRVNTQSGIIERGGAPGKRFWVRDFRWLRNAEPDFFEVEKQEWKDHSTSLIRDVHSLDELILISHAPMWRPGQRAGDTDVLLMNITTGETRRIPYAFGVVANGCLSKDRKRAYVAGHIPDEGSIGIFEVNLATGEHRRLGGADLQFGMTMFPVLSPDGRKLAVVHLEPTAGLLHSQIFIIDVASGESTKLGNPLDTASLSWLPKGEGLILISREYERLEEPSIDTICRMDMNGRLTPIRKGRQPLVLLPHSQFLFLDNETKEWKTCDLEGQNVRKVGDGLRGFGFPAASPNGRRLIMMKFGGRNGPQPHVVDIATGDSNPVIVGPGLWAMPAWR